MESGMDMVERVGDKLREECLAVFGATWNYDVAWRFARAAIEAMREMTPEMRAAMGQAIYDAGFNDWQHGWNAAIDTALKQHEEAK